MLQLFIGTAAYMLISVIIRIEEVKMDKAYKECEETDWNEYYANI